MRNAFCPTVLNKVKWVLKLPKNGILLLPPRQPSPPPVSHLHLSTGEYAHIHPETQPHK